MLRDDDHDFDAVRTRLARLPARSAPPQLILKLRKIMQQEPWYQKFFHWFLIPRVWKSVGAFGVVVCSVVTWMALRTEPEQAFVDMDTLLAAHSRYQEENLVPTADMAHADYSARLASFYDDEN